MLSGCNGASPWAGTASESAHYLVETALGGYSSRLISYWNPPDGYDPVAVSGIVPDYPNVWTDGSLVLDKVAGISSSGAGFFADHAASFWDARSWGQVDLHPVDSFPSCRVSALFLGLYSLFRELKCGELFWLYSLLVLFIWVWTILVLFVMLVVCLMGVLVLFLLNFLRMVTFFYSLTGCFVFVVLTLRISKVKGHADEAMVHNGQVREVDRFGNNAADEAADFGRRRVGNAVIDARRNLSGVCNRWYPVVLDLQRFFIAIS